MTVHKTTAGTDDECAWCAYPFDPGDSIVADDATDAAYCSRKCAKLHEKRLERISLRSAFLPDMLGDIR